MALAIVTHAIAFVLAPLLLGVINRTKAMVAGRRGPSLFQPYFDVRKLLAKGATYSETTTWVFRAAPTVGLAAVLTAALLVPMGASAVIHFDGDLLLFVGLLALGRWCIVLGAMDTGSAFEGMGASREAAFGALAEPGMLLIFGGLVALAGHTSLTAILAASSTASAGVAVITLALAAVGFALLTLAENSRIPVDDPTTHLELTMIHEVMVLDNSGPDFAYITYARALKLWIFASLFATLAVHGDSGSPATAIGYFAVILAAGVMVGLIESTRARLKMRSVPWLIASAGLCGLAGLIAAVV